MMVTGTSMLAEAMEVVVEAVRPTMRTAAPPQLSIQEACPKEKERKEKEKEAAAEVPQEGPARPANESRRERPWGSPTWPCGGEGRQRGSILSSAS